MSGSEDPIDVLPQDREARGWVQRHRRDRSRLGSAVAVTMVLSGLAWSGRTLAAEGDLYVTLHYTVDASAHGCWDEPEFRRGVAHRIGYDPFRDDAALEVRVHVGGATHAVDGHVEWRKANGLLMGERRFVAKDGNCAKLLTEMSFAVGLQIELLRPKPPVAAASPPAGGAATGAATGASGAAAGGSTAGASSAGTASTSTGGSTSAGSSPANGRPEGAGERREAEQPKESAEARAADASQRSAMWIGLGPALAWRLSPGLTSDARLFVGIRHHDLSFEIAAEATYPSTDEHWDGSGFRQTLIGGSLAFCGHHDLFAACLLGRASQIRATGLGVDHPRSPNGFVAQGGLRIAGTFPLGEVWAIGARLDLLGLLTPCKVELNQATVWEMPRLGALGGIDLLVRFR